MSWRSSPRKARVDRSGLQLARHGSRYRGAHNVANAVPYRAASGLGLKSVPATSCGCGQRQAIHPRQSPAHIFWPAPGRRDIRSKVSSRCCPDSPKSGADHAATRRALFTALQCAVACHQHIHDFSWQRAAIKISAFVQSSTWRAGSKVTKASTLPLRHAATCSSIGNGTTVTSLTFKLLLLQGALQHVGTHRCLLHPTSARAGQTPERGWAAMMTSALPRYSLTR